MARVTGCQLSMPLVLITPWRKKDNFQLIRDPQILEPEPWGCCSCVDSAFRCSPSINAAARQFKLDPVSSKALKALE